MSLLQYEKSPFWFALCTAVLLFSIYIYKGCLEYWNESNTGALLADMCRVVTGLKCLSELMYSSFPKDVQKLSIHFGTASVQNRGPD